MLKSFQRSKLRKQETGVAWKRMSCSTCFFFSHTTICTMHLWRPAQDFLCAETVTCSVVCTKARVGGRDGGRARGVWEESKVKRNDWQWENGKPMRKKKIEDTSGTLAVRCCQSDKLLQVLTNISVCYSQPPALSSRELFSKFLHFPGLFSIGERHPCVSQAPCTSKPKRNSLLCDIFKNPKHYITQFTSSSFWLRRLHCELLFIDASQYSTGRTRWEGNKPILKCNHYQHWKFYSSCKLNERLQSTDGPQKCHITPANDS